MLELDEQVVDVPGHAEVAAFIQIVSVDGNAGRFVACHLNWSHGVSSGSP
jgi:hypothetical protein